MNEFESKEWRSVALLRLVGYALLFLSLVDFVNIFIPPRFTNPIWEFQIVGELVEKMPVPAIGFAFIFFEKEKYRKDVEEIILKVLSWMALALGILFLLLIPLGINNTLRINNINNIQANNQLSQRLTQLQQINEQLNQATSEEEINKLFNNLNVQGRPPEINSPQALKSRVLSEINTAQKQVQINTETARKSQQLNLLKSSFKWNLGALIAGVLFIYIWKLTNWAR
jgi:hypothetical protein